MTMDNEIKSQEVMYHQRLYVRASSIYKLYQWVFSSGLCIEINISIVYSFIHVCQVVVLDTNCYNFNTGFVFNGQPTCV